MRKDILHERMRTVHVGTQSVLRSASESKGRDGCDKD